MSITLSHQFIEFALEQEALKFGEFTLKSGRISPYFFNGGVFQTGEALTKLGQFYAQAIVNSGVEFDVLFGPAYKGILLAAATSIALYTEHGINTPYCFNRKEKKNHGEGGVLVGAPLKGRVMIIDDVITAGTAIRESMELINEHNATLAGVAIALDRQEKGQGELSAIQEVEREYSIQVTKIASLNHLVDYMRNHQNQSGIKAILEYRSAFGIK